MSKLKNEELVLYRAKIKKYLTEIQELKDEVSIINSKYVKVWNDRDKYKQKILDAKQDIARFNLLVEEKSQKKSADLFRELSNLKKTLKRKDDEIDEKTKHNTQLK